MCVRMCERPGGRKLYCEWQFNFTLDFFSIFFQSVGVQHYRKIVKVLQPFLSFFFLHISTAFRLDLNWTKTKKCIPTPIVFCSSRSPSHFRRATIFGNGEGSEKPIAIYQTFSICTFLSLCLMYQPITLTIFQLFYTVCLRLVNFLLLILVSEVLHMLLIEPRSPI